MCRLAGGIGSRPGQLTPTMATTAPVEANLICNSLDLIEGDGVVAAIVQAGRAGAFVAGHLLGNFQLAAVLDGRS